MSTTTYLHPNHYPEDFCCQVVTLGKGNTAIFRNDREVQMVVDSITILPGAKSTSTATTAISFRIDSAAGAIITQATVPVNASPATGATTFNVAYVLKPGETVFYVGGATVDTLCVQLRVRSRVA
jgi:predicted amino acid dehydrogenase